jgi:hypothetical protein
MLPRGSPSPQAGIVAQAMPSDTMCRTDMIPSCVLVPVRAYLGAPAPARFRRTQVALPARTAQVMRS